MTAEQTTTELTTRDVLQQVDRRLTLIEADLRSLDEKVDDKIDGLRSETRVSFEHVHLRIDALSTKLDTKLDSHLKWTLGTMITLTGLTVTVFGLIVAFLKF